MARIVNVILYLGLCVLQTASSQGTNATKSCPFGNTAQDIAAQSGLNLEGKIALVTGGRSGLGRRIAEALLARNCTVIIASRHEMRNQLAVEDMAYSYPGSNVSYMTFDLEDFSSVRSFAANFIQSYPRLDYYFGNAGQSEELTSSDITMDGFERMFQVNYVAQFLLVQLLLPLMRDTPSASRIILTASSTHATACGNLGLGEQDEDGNQFCFDETIDNSAFDYLPLDKKRFESVPASAWGCGYGPYSVSKYLMIQFGKELAKRELGNNVYAYSFAPGPINTGLLPGTFDCCFVNQGYGWPGPQCRWDLPYVGPTDEAGNPNPPPYSVPNFWVSPEHGTMSPMFAALQADESDSGSFISTYYEW